MFDLDISGADCGTASHHKVMNRAHATDDSTAAFYWLALLANLSTRGVIIALGSPLQQLIKGRTKRLPPIGQAVLNLGRNLMMNNAANDSIILHPPKLLDQHLLRNCRNGTL